MRIVTFRAVATVIGAAAIVGAIAGFAAGRYASMTGEANPETAAMIDAKINAEVEARVGAQVDARLAELGVGSASDLDGRISGGVAQFLADQPEAVYGALERHQANEQAREEEARRQTVADLGSALTSQPNDPAFGATAADADVVLVEFFDYRCGYCKRAMEGVMSLADADPKLRVVMKEFPILGPESVAATRVSLAANLVDPALYKEFHVALMRYRGGYDAASLLGLAAEFGYDPAAVQTAMNDEAVTAQIRNGYEIAEALGIRGTPAFVIGDQVIPGAVGPDRLKAAIEEARGARKG